MSTRRGVARRVCGSLGAAAVVLACNGTEVGPAGNPSPVVASIDPSVVDRTPAGVDVTVLGAGFVEETEVLWNGASRPTTYLGSTELSVHLSASDLSASSGEISVRSPEPGGGVSGTTALLVANLPPVLSSISPTQAEAVVTSQVVLDVTGSDFVAGAQVLWDGVPLETTASSASALQANVPDYLLRDGRSVTVTTSNPLPGGGESNGLTFTVNNPVPVVTEIDPAGVTVGTDSPIDVVGTGFATDASVWVDATKLTPVSVSGSRLSVVVPAALAVAGTTLDVSVENPVPAGGVSNVVSIEVWAIPAVIDQLYPSRVLAGAPDFTLVVSGSDFDPAATVTWNGTPAAATIVSSSRIEISVPAADVATPDTVDIVVNNPGTGIGATAELVVLPPPSSGSLIAVIRGDERGIVLADPSGVEVQSTSFPNQGVFLDASPVGSTVVFQDYPRIYEMDAFTGVTRRVTPATYDAILGREQWARYSADGQWIYFMALSGAGTKWEIWRVAATGGDPELLVSNPTYDVGYPAISHGGDKVVYAVRISPSDTSARLWVLDLGTGVSTPLDVRGYTSRWTPDDQWIVYWPGHDGDLRAVHPDGTGDVQISTGQRLASGFDLSPDGQWAIAAREDRTAAVLIAFPTGEATPLTSLGSAYSAAWFGP